MEIIHDCKKTFLCIKMKNLLNIIYQVILCILFSYPDRFLKDELVIFYSLLSNLNIFIVDVNQKRNIAFVRIKCNNVKYSQGDSLKFVSCCTYATSTRVFPGCASRINIPTSLLMVGVSYPV